MTMMMWMMEHQVRHHSHPSSSSSYRHCAASSPYSSSSSPPPLSLGSLSFWLCVATMLVCALVFLPALRARLTPQTMLSCLGGLSLVIPARLPSPSALILVIIVIIVTIVIVVIIVIEVIIDLGFWLGFGLPTHRALSLQHRAAVCKYSRTSVHRKI